MALRRSRAAFALGSALLVACNGAVFDEAAPDVVDEEAPVAKRTNDAGPSKSPAPVEPLTVVPPSRSEVIAVAERVNDTFMAKWPDPGVDVVIVSKPSPSNTWARAVYFEGLMGLYGVTHDEKLVDYAVAWGESHDWGLDNGASTRNADDHCAAQTYLDLYAIEPEAKRIAQLESSIDAMVTSADASDWTWIDAIQMAMPVFARLGVLRSDAKYFDKMYAFYTHTKHVEGGGLYNPADHLWWRDKKFRPPYVEPNGEDCYWSRGNGWVYAGLARVLDVLPTNDPHREEYLEDFRDMSEALRAVRRSDGYWNVSLHDPAHFGGREMTGTSLFVYGMAWGVRAGVLDEARYRPIVVASWNAMANRGVRSDGALGYVQGTGTKPADRQPVTFETVPVTEDFPVGCFLLAASEVAKLVSE